MKIISLLLLCLTLALIGCESAKPRVELRQGEANATQGTAPSDSKK